MIDTWVYLWVRGDPQKKVSLRMSAGHAALIAQAKLIQLNGHALDVLGNHVGIVSDGEAAVAHINVEVKDHYK